MADSSKVSALNHHSKWRLLIVCLLITLGMVSAVSYMSAHWIERQILTTSNWVEVVGPLPKDDTVSTALSGYAVNQLFSVSDLQNRIEQALPDKAAFIAAPLADQLETRLTDRTKQAIQSDKFEALWRQANAAAMDRLVTNARDTSEKQSVTVSRFNIDLASLRETVSNILDKRGIERPNSDKVVALSVNLQTSREKLHSYIRLVDFANATLGLLAIVCLVGAVVLSHSRRKALLVISGIASVIALLEIIGITSLRPYILNHIQQHSYQPAVGVVYDTLVASLRSAAVNVFVWSLVIFTLAYFLHTSILNQSKVIAAWLKTMRDSATWKWFINVRIWLRVYRRRVIAALCVLMLAVVAFLITLDWRSGIRSVLFTMLLIELVYLISARPKEARMKQTAPKP